MSKCWGSESNSVMSCLVSTHSACGDQAAWPQKHQHSSPHSEPPFLSCAVESNTCPHGCRDIRLSVLFSLLLLPSFSQVTLFSALLWNQITGFFLGSSALQLQPRGSSLSLFPVHTHSATFKPQGWPSKQGPARLLSTSPGSRPRPGTASWAPGSPNSLGTLPSSSLCPFCIPSFSAFRSLCLFGLLMFQPVFPARRPGIRPEFEPCLSHLLPGDME